jgi:shikimate kinase
MNASRPIARTIARPIALVGMMGAGKSTVGQLLAARLGWRFVDSDAEIERVSGRTVANLFAYESESAFRTRERAAIDGLLDGSPLVLAAGGGAFAHPRTRQLILDRAAAVWIQVDVEILAKRIADAPGRPLLDPNNPLESLRRLHAQRLQGYALAPIRVDGGAAPDRVVDAILAAR